MALHNLRITLRAAGVWLTKEFGWSHQQLVATALNPACQMSLSQTWWKDRGHTVPPPTGFLGILHPGFQQLCARACVPGGVCRSV